MRSFLLFICLAMLARGLQAQEEERKLVDRLLRPDLSLVNPAQDKKFPGVDASMVGNQLTARTLCVGEPQPAKRFTETRDLLAKSFAIKKFAGAEAAANEEPNAEPACASVYQSKQSDLVRTASAANKSVAVREYGDNRPFLGKGTRQEILKQQDHPLTIAEVRELLNKNR